MKAVDVLVAARARLSDINNWTVGSLVRRRTQAKDGFCFCSIGATLKEGGAYTPEMKLLTDEILEYNNPKGCPDEASRNSASNLARALHVENASEERKALSAVSSLSGVLKHYGFQAKATIRALAYLQAAARQMYNIQESEHARGLVININDAGNENVSNHERVLSMFDRAIKNAKRRHIAGKARAVAPVA